MVKNPPAGAGDARDVGSVPASGRRPGGGNDTDAGKDLSVGGEWR